MSLKSMFFLATVLLPSVLALTVMFDNREEAEYEFLKVDAASLKLEQLQGAQAIIRFARVVSSPDGYEFKAGDEVVLKIADAGMQDEIKREQKEFDFIRNEGLKDCVVKAEKFLARPKDFKREELQNLPNSMAYQHHGNLIILITERMGRNLLDMAEKMNRFEEDELETIYGQLIVTLEQLKRTGIVHEDVNPKNIFFKKSSKTEEEEVESRDKVKDGIKLTISGIDVRNVSTLGICEVDELYVSPIQHILKRKATHNDAAVSAAYSIIYVGDASVPWIGAFLDTLARYRTEKIWIAKHRFNQNPTFSKGSRLSAGLQQKLKTKIEEATKHEAGRIQKEIDEYIGWIRGD